MNSKIPEKLFVLEVTTNIGCRINCRYCPQKLLLNRYTAWGSNKAERMMSFELFKKCLLKVRDNANISFCGMSEPFLNPSCSRMIRYAYDKGYKVSLFTTLVGMTHADFEQIRDIVFDNVVLHIPDMDGNANIPITQEYLDAFKLFSDRVRIDSYSCHGRVHPAIEGYIRKDILLRDEMHGRAGNLEAEEVKKYRHKGRIVCKCGISMTGFAPVLLPDGRLLLCGNDYGMQHVLGNLYLEDWAEIACGAEMKKVLDGFSDDKLKTLCRTCHNAAAENQTQNQFALGPVNALRIANKFHEAKADADSLNARQKQIWHKLSDAENVCVFGCGKLFHDNYFQSNWKEVVEANLITDNVYGKIQASDAAGMKIIAPDELKNYEKLLVVTYMKDSREVEQQLESMGIDNYINIYDLYHFFKE